jgi:hypothetical protein
MMKKITIYQDSKRKFRKKKKKKQKEKKGSVVKTRNKGRVILTRGRTN